MKKVLWLASWYPNKLHPFDGDFIQRHARAAALYQPVHVIYVVKDEEGRVTSNLMIERTNHEGLSEVIAYYKPVIAGPGFLKRVFSILNYLRINLQLIRDFIKENGKPELVHVHVALWAGLLASWLKFRYRVPYIITEHWSGYHNESLVNVYNNGKMFRRLNIRVLTQAKMLLPVSAHLGNAVNNLARIQFKVVPNTVDTCFFNLEDRRSGVFRFIHVSTMNHPKNVEGILNALNRLLSVNKEWECLMVGPESPSLRKYASRLALDSHVNWLGEIPYRLVAEEMKKAHALVMFSRYENLPCVILEAQCCGLPVIASSVGGIPEIVSDTNGILVKAFDEEGLFAAMKQLIHQYSKYDREKISAEASLKYSFQAIGKQLAVIYKEVFDKP